MNNQTEKKHYFDFSRVLKNHAHSSVLISAVDLEIFEALKDNFLSIEELKEKCGIKIRNRNLADFLDILYLNNHLIREGKLDYAKYKVSDNLFLKENPNNALPLIKMMKRIIKRLELLPDIMRSGRFPNDVDLFQELYSDPENTNSFLHTMSLLQLNSFKLVAKDFDFSTYKTCLDIGGCLGAFSIEMKLANPHLKVTTFDLPIIEKHVTGFLQERNMLDQVNIISGDFFLDEFPKSDIVSMGNILHDWNHEKKQILMKKAYNCLNENGIFIVVEKFIDNQREEDGPALYISFNMCVECLDGFNVSKEELEVLAKEAGFKSVDFHVEKDGVEVAFLKK